MIRFLPTWQTRKRAARHIMRSRRAGVAGRAAARSTHGLIVFTTTLPAVRLTIPSPLIVHSCPAVACGLGPPDPVDLARLRTGSVPIRGPWPVFFGEDPERWRSTP